MDELLRVPGGTEDTLTAACPRVGTWPEQLECEVEGSLWGGQTMAQGGSKPVTPGWLWDQ